MQIDRIVKETIKQYKSEIELFQWAVISAVASLVYSEYIRNIKQKHVPVKMFQVPSIKFVNELLDKDGYFMQLLSERLIDGLKEHELLSLYIDAPELILFTGNNIEKLKMIIDIYIIPNISGCISKTIAAKFSLNDPNQQLIRESNEIDLFKRNQISDSQFKFIVDETALQLLMLLPSVNKDTVDQDQNINIQMASNSILTICNDNAICPIYFDSRILDNMEIMDLLSFVTNTTANKVNGGGDISYIVTSGVFNQLSITKINGIR